MTLFVHFFAIVLGVGCGIAASLVIIAITAAILGLGLLSIIGTLREGITQGFKPKPVEHDPLTILESRINVQS